MAGPWAIQVALAMPTSAELWVTLINVMCYATAVPVNLVNTPQELADEMRGCSVRYHRPISSPARARAREATSLHVFVLSSPNGARSVNARKAPPPRSGRLSLPCVSPVACG